MRINHDRARAPNYILVTNHKFTSHLYMYVEVSPVSQQCFTCEVCYINPKFKPSLNMLRANRCHQTKVYLKKKYSAMSHNLSPPSPPPPPHTHTIPGNRHGFTISQSFCHFVLLLCVPCVHLNLASLRISSG